MGGLLLTKEAGNSYLPMYDGNGNVMGMIKGSDGSLAAAYEYDAFGQTLRESGPYTGNPLRFSSKYTDAETGEIYYGLRYYSPSQGRFVTRDPIAEKGGRNLYAFAANNGINSWDYLGLDHPEEVCHYEDTWVTNTSTPLPGDTYMGSSILTSMKVCQTVMVSDGNSGSNPSGTNPGGGNLGGGNAGGANPGAGNSGNQSNPQSPDAPNKPCDEARSAYNAALTEFNQLHAAGNSAIEVRDRFQSSISRDSFWQEAVNNAPHILDALAGIADAASPVEGMFVKGFTYDMFGPGRNPYDPTPDQAIGMFYMYGQGLRYLVAWDEAQLTLSGAERFMAVKESIGRANAAAAIGTLAIENVKIYGPGYMNMVNQNGMLAGMNETILEKQNAALASLESVKRLAAEKDAACK